MSSILPARSALDDIRTVVHTYWPILVGLAVLYLATYLDLSRTIWRTEEDGHGPIILAVAIFLAWHERKALLGLAPEPRVLIGGTLLAFGLLLYVVGRSQGILIFEIGSQIPVIAGLLYIALGSPALRVAWFPILFLVFMIPLPGFVIDTLTGPLKQSVSAIVDQVLYSAGYPIGRSGVVLTIGQYQLLVADACSGLHSMFSLSALGVLYLYLMQHKSWLQNGILLASIVPIAFAANIVRTIVLVLVTFHFGDEAGQGFLHGTAGLVLFVAALGLLFTVDRFLSVFLERAPPGNGSIPQ